MSDVHHQGDKAAPESKAVEVPESALVHCPKQRFALVRIAHACPGCADFDGLDDRFPGAETTFENRFAVRCFGEPVKRAVVRMVEVA